MKYSIVTFGCRVNQADSFGFEEELLAKGAAPSRVEEADLVLVNTCSVTSTADQGARQTIRRIARTNPDARIVVTGCYATRRPEEVASLPNVVRVVPNSEKPQLISVLRRTDFVRSVRALAGSARPELVEGRFQPDRSQPDNSRPDLTSADRFGDGDGSCGATIEPGIAGRTAFTLRVQTGCAEVCAYCIIPMTRGEPRSAGVEQVLSDVDRVTSAGFKEIVLTGVHLGSYGSDLSPSSSLAELLSALEKQLLPTDVLFRISSLEPMDCTPAVVHIMSNSVRFAAHLHLPLQHASDRMLAAMRRPYTIAQYDELVQDIRRRMPHASIGSDIIVGFPGETDEDFEQLSAYLETSPLTHLHVFPYSDRPGTAASGMSGKVPGPAIRERGRRIREISERLTRRFLDSQVGTVHRALTLEDGSLVVTGNYLKVRIPAGHQRNEWVSIRLTSHHDGELLGG